LKENARKYHHDNSEIRLVQIKEYHQNNKEKLYKKQKEYYQKNIENILDNKRVYHQEHKKERMEYNKKYREDHKEEISERQKKYREENKDDLKKHREERKDEINEYIRNRRKVDEGFRIKHCLRTRLRNALKGISKTVPTMKLIGVPSIEFLRDYLEGTKVEGKDYSDAHIDHIRPCASFDLTDPEQQRECFHYTNLQYLPAKENMSKGARIL